MNPNGHLAMNGFNGASSSSHNFTQDFSHPRTDQQMFNHNISMQQQSQPLHQSPSMLQQQQHNHWQQHQQHPTPQNSHLSHSSMQSQHQGQFNQGAWANQMPQSQQFSNPMLAMGLNMPLMSQQIIQEALSMSTPVDATDEPVLLTTLLKAKKIERSFREALNSLHGTNGHSASLWKDYYLEHKDRLDDWIGNCVEKEKADKRLAASKLGIAPHTNGHPIDRDVRRTSIPTAKKPSPASFKREPSPHVSSSSRLSISAPPVKHPPKRPSKPTSTPPMMDVSTAGRRNTMNSLSAPEPVYGARLPAPNTEIRIPEPPSRSPSPPTNVIPQGRGNKYTKEDREFFIKFIGWRLKQDPSLNRLDLCNMLAEKAPHHTTQSWGSHWSNNHDLPDKILAAARGDEYVSDDASSEDEKAPTKRPSRPKYRDSTSEDEDADEDDDEDGDTPFRHYSDKEMAASGMAFNEADLYITANYIAEFPNWNGTIAKDKWEPYHQKHPQRSAKAWAEYYRRNERELNQLVKKIKKQKNSAVAPNLGRPSKLPTKRKLESDMSEAGLAKRGKAE